MDNKSISQFLFLSCFLSLAIFLITFQPVSANSPSPSVNHAPSFTKGPDQTSNADAGRQEIPGWATGVDDGDGGTQRLHFEVIENTNPDLFKEQPWVSWPSRTLRYEAKPGASGKATVTLVLKDNGGTANGGKDTSAPQTVIITIGKFIEEPTSINGTVHLPEQLKGKSIRVANSTNTVSVRLDGGFTILNPFQSNQISVYDEKGRPIFRALSEPGHLNVDATSTAFYYAFFNNFALRQLDPRNRAKAKMLIRDIPEFKNLVEAVELSVSENGYLNTDMISSQINRLAEELNLMFWGLSNNIASRTAFEDITAQSLKTVTNTVDYIRGIALKEEKITKIGENNFTVDLELRSIRPLPVALWKAETQKDENGEYSVIQEKIGPPFMLKAQNASNFIDVITSPIDTAGKMFEFMHNYWVNIPEKGKFGALGAAGDVTDAVTNITLENMSCSVNAIFLEDTSVEAETYLLVSELFKLVDVIPGVTGDVTSRLGFAPDKNEILYVVTKNLLENQDFTDNVSAYIISGNVKAAKKYLFSNEFLVNTFYNVLAQSTAEIAAKRLKLSDEEEAGLAVTLFISTVGSHLSLTGVSSSEKEGVLNEIAAAGADGIDSAVKVAFDKATTIVGAKFFLDAAAAGGDWLLELKAKNLESYHRLLDGLVEKYCSDFVDSDENEAPVFRSLPLKGADVGEEYSYTVEVTDPNTDDSLTISAVEKPSWLKLENIGRGTARLFGTPKTAGSYNVKLLVTDDGTPQKTDTQSFTIVVDDALVLTSLTINGPSTVDENSTATYEATADFSDGSAVNLGNGARQSWSVKPSTSYASMDFRTLITGEVSRDETVTIMASYSFEGVTKTDTYSVTIKNDEQGDDQGQNEAPVFKSTPVEDAAVGQQYTYNVVAEDPNPGDKLTISVIEKPSWLTLVNTGNGTAKLTGTPPSAGTGSDNVELLVTDDGTPQKTDTQSFTIVYF